MKQRLIFILVGVLLVGSVIWMFWPTKKTLAPTTPVNVAVAVNVANDVDVPTNIASNLIGFSTADLPDRDPAFEFTAQMPSTWRVEYVASAHAINIYDSRSTGSSSLEKSVVFISYYSATIFTPSTSVVVKSRTETTIGGKAALTTTVQNKSNVKNLIGQPTWINLEHQVTDIRTTEANPTIFYSFAKVPNLATAQYDAFLSSITYASNE